MRDKERKKKEIRETEKTKIKSDHLNFKWT
jgi:hypothetical protein